VRYEIRIVVESENMKTREHVVDLRVDGQIILKCIFEKYRLTTWSIGSHFIRVSGIAALY
jgi:hypothetical protein